MKAVFFANAGSRSGSDQFEAAQTAIQDAGIILRDSILFEDTNLFKDAVNQAVENQEDVIIVGGGDGTISLAIDSIAESKSVLGVLPMGTGNQFARELGIEADFKSAADNIFNGRICAVDVGDVNGNKFINVATIGISNEIANNLSFKKELGKLAYVPAVIQSLADVKPFQLTLKHGDETIEKETIQLVVCNGRYHAGPFIASPEATLSDSCLDAYFVKPTNLWQMAQISSMALTGSHISLEPVSLVRAQKLVVNTQPKLPVTLDGETVWHDELIFSCLPAALNVFVPESFRAPSERFKRFASQN